MDVYGCVCVFVLNVIACSYKNMIIMIVHAQPTQVLFSARASHYTMIFVFIFILYESDMIGWPLDKNHVAYKLADRKTNNACY